MSSNPVPNRRDSSHSTACGRRSIQSQIIHIAYTLHYRQSSRSNFSCAKQISTQLGNLRAELFHQCFLHILLCLSSVYGQLQSWTRYLLEHPAPSGRVVMVEAAEDPGTSNVQDILTAGQARDVKATNKRKELDFKKSHGLLIGFLTLIM